MFEDLREVWDAFWLLSTCRGGFGGPIPWDVIDRYARRAGMEGEDYEEFLTLIRGMDAEYLDATRPPE